MSNDFNDGIVGKRRKGTPDDPFRSITESLSVINGKVPLTEIPNRFEKVKVTGNSVTMYEIIDGELADNLYKVDYTEGVVFFNSSHNNTTKNFQYLGEGRHFFPAKGVWLTQTDNGDIQTIDEKIDRIDSDILSQKQRVDQQIVSIPQPNEILDIRVDRNGIVYPVAKDRLDADQKKIEDAYMAKNGINFNTLKERLDEADDYDESLNSLISVLRNDVGIPTKLTTVDKASIVAGINSIKSELDEDVGNLTAHTSDTNNPHGTMASQVGAYSKSESDANYVLKSVGITGSGQRIEILEISFISNGSSTNINSTITFSTAFTSPPRIVPMNVTQTTSYIDTQMYPFIYNVSTTSMSVKVQTYDLGHNFSAGTIKMCFMAIGK